MNHRNLYRLLTGILLIGVLLGGLTSSAGAQSYSFSVPKVYMQVYVQPDASVRIVYDITFKNSDFGIPIDIVDIGTPHANYQRRSFSASIDGHALNTIRRSEYVDPSVEIPLRPYEIERGEEATLHVDFTMPDMVYQDTTNRDLASLQITPTWWDPDFVNGNSDIWIVIHLPEGIQPDEALYQKAPFTDKALYEGHTIVGWRWEEGTATRAYPVGVSFPKRVMSRVVSMTLFELVNKYLNDNPFVWTLLGLGNLTILAVLFFRYSGGTGLTVYAILAAMLACPLYFIPWSTLIAVPLLLALTLWNESNLKRRRNTYLPPIAEVEGGGIKRGLTAPEAAIILEMPLNKVLTLVIFGMLEKGLVEQVEATPLRVRVADAYAGQKSTEELRKIAQVQGTVIHRYEAPFLKLIEKQDAMPLEKIDFSKAMKILIEGAAAKMKGFDLSDTQAYYQRVITRAWEQAEKIGEIEKREEYIDNYLPWIMMNERRPTVFTGGGGYTYWPRWVRHSSSGGGGMPSVGGGKSTSAPGGRTTLGDVGASFAGWAESTMGNLSGSILPSSLQGGGAGGGFVDLSGVDRVTGDVFTALMESSNKGGGGGRTGGGRIGGGCACACAGCACACACAGGGR